MAEKPEAGKPTEERDICGSRSTPSFASVPSGAPAPSSLDHDGLDMYVRRLFAREDHRLREIREGADRAGLPRIQLPPTTARTVQLLVRATGARRVLEVGTLAGYSATWIARALPDGGRLFTLEVSEDHARVARRSLKRARLLDRVEVCVGDAAVTMAQLGPDGSFDAVFLDADKERYPAYLEEGARLIRPGGILMADNAFWKGRVLTPEDDQTATLIHRFNELLASDSRFEATILPVGDGLAVAVRR